MLKLNFDYKRYLCLVFDMSKIKLYLIEKTYSKKERLI